MVVYILQGLTLGFSAGVSPGPMHAYLLSQTLKNGWRRALPAVLAPLLSDGPIITLVLIVLTQMPGWALRALQVAGGVFILTLAWSAYRDMRAARHDLTPSPDSARQSLQKAVLVNLLNPNPYIFWGVVGGPILLDGWHQAANRGAAFVAAFYVALIGTFAGFVAIFATAGRLGPTAQRVFSGVSALALFGFGVYQLVTGLVG